MHVAEAMQVVHHLQRDRQDVQQPGARPQRFEGPQGQFKISTHISFNSREIVEKINQFHLESERRDVGHWKYFSFDCVQSFNALLVFHNPTQVGDLVFFHEQVFNFSMRRCVHEILELACRPEIVQPTKERFSFRWFKCVKIQPRYRDCQVVRGRARHVLHGQEPQSSAPSITTSHTRQDLAPTNAACVNATLAISLHNLNQVRL
mmetsp:Transcript_52191/g.139018  ORF Transcript_52191/g.139018 Transcript_52191/m.139018 type:complete len:205 (+) Transcript_52191:470-1084(+)